MTDRLESAVALAATAATTLLTYALQVTPDPLAVGAPGTLGLVVSNGGHVAVTCASISLLLPVGTSAKDLVSAPTGIQTLLPAGWSAQQQSGGSFTFTPSGAAATIGANGVQFVLANVPVNGQAGVARLIVTETAATTAQPAPVPRTATIDVPKFPAVFALGDLTIVSPERGPVAPGDTATLTWRATGDGAAFTMSYQPTEGGVPVVETVGRGGPFTSRPLTRAAGVDFLLTATVAVPGQPAPLVVQRQRSIAVRSVTLALAVEPTVVGTGGLVKLTWDAPNADRCTLEDGTVLPPSGTAFIVLRESRQLTMTAIGGGARVPPQQQRALTVDPRIVPTEAGWSIVGGPGGRGANGESGSDDIRPPRWPSEGHPGGAGGAAVVRGAVPRLDPSSRPARVIPINLVGGPGGEGGVGGAFFTRTGPMINGQSGGLGGAGGDARFEVTTDPGAGAPAQYVVVALKPGDPGMGGKHGTRDLRAPRGASGVASLAIDGVRLL